MRLHPRIDTVEDDVVRQEVLHYKFDCLLTEEREQSHLEILAYLFEALDSPMPQHQLHRLI